MNPEVTVLSKSIHSQEKTPGSNDTKEILNQTYGRMEIRARKKSFLSFLETLQEIMKIRDCLTG